MNAGWMNSGSPFGVPDGQAADGSRQERRRQDSGGRNRLAIQHRAVADDHHRQSHPGPTCPRRRRAADARRFNLDEAIRVEDGRVRDAVQRGKDVAAIGVHPGGHARACRQVAAAVVRQRFKRRDADHPASLHERESLQRRDPDPQTGERSWSGGHRKEIDAGEGCLVGAGERENLRGQPLGVRPRRIAAAFVDNRVVVDDRDAAHARRSVQSEHSHLLSAFSLQLSAFSLSTAES